MRRPAALNFLVQNFGWMVMSLFLAMVIWVAANMANNPVVQDEVRNVSVQVLLPQGFVITDRPDAPTVTAVVRAARSEWDLLTAEDVLVTADLRGFHEPGTYRVELEAEIAAPLHGKVVALRPGTWTLSIDREVEARLPIQVVVTETPPLGYTYSRDITCDAQEVIVRGSAERVEAVQRVEARLDLSDALNPVHLTVNLTPVKENGFRARQVELEPPKVTCEVDIQAREDVTPVEVLPDRGGTTPPFGYTFQGYSHIEPSRVGVTGDPDAIAAMNSVVRTAPIDLSDKTETFTTEVPLVLPQGVTLVEGEPVVRVTVLIAPVMGSREFQNVPLEVVGLDTARYRVSGMVNTVTVNVAGPQARLPELRVDDIRVVVDLSDLPPGNHQLTPQGSILGQAETGVFTISSILPEQLSVTIEPLEPTPTGLPFDALEG